MNSLKTQQGVGLIEVLVALIILAVGVLGFAALQFRAVNATAEAMNRVEAMNLAIDLAERMRANQTGLSKAIVVKDEQGKDTDQKISAYIKAFQGKTYIETYSWSSCYKTNKCSSTDLATQDANQILYQAFLKGMKVAVNDCPGGLQREKSCIYIAWGKTQPSNSSASDSCTNDGSYLSTAECLIFEAY